jgi:hypothetical protein
MIRGVFALMWHANAPNEKKAWKFSRLIPDPAGGIPSPAAGGPGPTCSRRTLAYSYITGIGSTSLA